MRFLFAEWFSDDYHSVHSVFTLISFQNYIEGFFFNFIEKEMLGIWKIFYYRKKNIIHPSDYRIKKKMLWSNWKLFEQSIISKIFDDVNFSLHCLSTSLRKAKINDNNGCILLKRIFDIVNIIFYFLRAKMYRKWNT